MENYSVLLYGSLKLKIMIQITPIFKEAIKWLGWVLLFASLWFHGCSRTASTPQIVKVNVPEVKGVFEAIVPDNVPITLENGNIEKSVAKQSLSTENPINAKLLAENEQLKADFTKANDSIKKLQFSNAIVINDFSSVFEDSILKININGKVRGEVKQVTPTYTIKQKTVETQIIPKETVFRLLGGLEIGNNKNLSNPLFKANLGVQNRKGNVISVSYDNNKNFYLGYQFSIFNIKR